MYRVLEYLVIQLLKKRGKLKAENVAPVKIRACVEAMCMISTDSLKKNEALRKDMIQSE